jgi:chromosome segregation ATPase
VAQEAEAARLAADEKLAKTAQELEAAQQRYAQLEDKFDQLAKSAATAAQGFKAKCRDLELLQKEKTGVEAYVKELQEMVAREISEKGALSSALNAEKRWAGGLQTEVVDFRQKLMEKDLSL